ncbi:MAG: amidohydrolase family protein [Myxococcaceae bacterium]
MTVRVPGRVASSLLLAALSTGCLTTHHPRQLVRLEAEQPAGILFHDVSVFTGTSESLVEHQDVYVRGGRIESIGATGSATVPAAAQVIEGSGKTLMPGLVDLHGHLTGTASPPWALAWPDADHTGQSYLYCGVTSVYDVAGDLDELAKVRKREAAGEWVGPRFTYSGQMVTASNGYPASMVRDLFNWPVSSVAIGHFATEVTSAVEAEKAVDLRQRLGADHIKVGLAEIPLGSPVFTPELLHSVVESAHRRGMKVVAHIDTEAHALLAARAGVDVLVHLVHLGPLSPAAARELAERKVPVVLTLVAFQRMEDIKQLRYQPTEIERELNPPEMLEPYSPSVVAKADVTKGMGEWVAALISSHDQRIANVKVLLDAGVEVLAGSDGEGSAATWAGGAYLEELQLMAKAGVPPAQVLLGATSRAARIIQPEPDFGAIEPAKRADLLLVQGDPLADLDLGGRIVAVMQGGKWVERMRPAKPLAAR